MLVIIINGESSIGKDTIIDYFKEEAKKYKHKVVSIDSVAKVKEAAMLLGWDGEKTPANRAFLHILKLISDDAFNSSTNYVIEEILDNINKEDVSMAFVHIREADAIRKLEDILTKKYDIPCVKLLVKGISKDSGTLYGDQSVNDTYYHYIIENYSTLDSLRHKVVEFHSWIDSQFAFSR